MPELRAAPEPRERQRGTPAPDAASARPALLVLALAYTLFVIYGSLVPLDFRPHPWPEAVAAFGRLRYLALGIGSRADWVANILLFVPLAFLWLGVLWHPRSALWRVAASVLVLVAGAGLSVAIEFTQLFFPPRTVSLNDIYAEFLGSSVGLALWWASGASVSRWYLGWRAAGGSMDLARRLLYGYLFVLFGYNLLPLDLTLSPVELYHKWRAGRMVLIPFSDGQGELAQRLYGYLTDALIWIPAGVLARLTATRHPRQIWLWLVAAAAALEFFQLFVFTRVSDTTDLLTAGLGAAAGLWVAGRWRAPGASAAFATPSASAAWLTAGLLFWLALVFSVFWYPFDFRADGAFVRGQLATAAARVPFAAYYFGTEYRAATEVLHKTGFFLPLGMLCALLAGRIRHGPVFWWKTAALAAVVLAAGAVEAGQLFLPGKFADLTDWLLEIAGGWAGCALAWKIRPMLRVSAAPAAHVPRRGIRWLYGGLLLAFAALLAALPHLPAVPYNLRELIAPEHPWLSALALACAVAWISGFPAWAAAHLAADVRPAGRLPFLLLLHGIAAWALLRLAVPPESMQDLVGAAVLGWPWEWESLGRFLALFAPWSVVSFAAAFVALRPRLPRAGRLAWGCAAAALAVLPAAYVVSVRHAATDNLTELLSGSGSPSAFLWVAAGIFVLALAGSRVACALGAGRRSGAAGAALWAAASFPLAYFALRAGLEPYVIKYDRTFSAFQFLLSRDRSHYAAPAELFLRYGFAHTALLLAIAASQAPFLGRGTQAPAEPWPALARSRPRRSRTRGGVPGRKLT